MIVTYRLRHLAFAVLTVATVVIGALSATVMIGVLSPAAAQVPEDAQIALEEYGSWRPHPRFGEVWTPRGVPPDWRPYQYGHWVYTDEWGWYWVSDDVEADWGWVVFHYGRWAFEPGFGWFWVPGDEWAPAWVNWRYGDQYVGWAPLPPDELIERFEIEPAYWVFVPSRFIAAPGLRPYIVPSYRRSVILRETRIVNRTVPVHGRLAVNPGISPAFVARVNGAPIPTYRVRPRVFASTQGVAGFAGRAWSPEGSAGRTWRRGWTRWTPAPGSRFRSTDHHGYTAKRRGHRAATAWQKRTRSIGDQSATRGTRWYPGHSARGSAATSGPSIIDSRASHRRACATGRASRTRAGRGSRRFAATADGREACSAAGASATVALAGIRAVDNGAADSAGQQRARTARRAPRRTSRTKWTGRRWRWSAADHCAADPATGAAATTAPTTASAAAATTASAATAAGAATAAATAAGAAAARPTTGRACACASSARAGPTAEEAAAETRREARRKEIAAVKHCVQRGSAGRP